MLTTTILILLLLLVFLLVGSLRVANEYERAVIFRLGRLQGLKGPGIYFVFPLLDSQKKVDTRTITVDVEPQETITKDSVTIKVNAVLYYRIADPVKAIMDVANYRSAVYQASLTTLRNSIGQHPLDDLLKSRDSINTKLREIIDEISDPWGIKVEMVEVKDVEIPTAMQRAMAREAEAVREKRARLIKAQGEKEASEMLSQASQLISKNPAALELRRMQMITEVGAEHNTTTIVMLPSDFITLSKEMSEYLRNENTDAKKDE
jgi:regulator of protease activity HflC (stomatin/prohibitin superfamily)